MSELVESRISAQPSGRRKMGNLGPPRSRRHPRMRGTWLGAGPSRSPRARPRPPRRPPGSAARRLSGPGGRRYPDVLDTIFGTRSQRRGYPPTSRGKNSVSSALGTNVRFTTVSPDAVRTAAVKPAPVNSFSRKPKAPPCRRSSRHSGQRFPTTFCHAKPPCRPSRVAFYQK
jgi:hypothetical protein